MDVTGSYAFRRPPADIWDLLVDPDIVACCLPGCERLEPIGDDTYRAVLEVNVAAINGTFTGTVSMREKQPPHSYRLVVNGTGRGGFVNGDALIELSELDGTTLVKVTGEAKVGGLIACVGQRLLSTVSKTMMDRFFFCLQNRVCS